MYINTIEGIRDNFVDVAKVGSNYHYTLTPDFFKKGTMLYEVPFEYHFADGYRTGTLYQIWSAPSRDERDGIDIAIIWVNTYDDDCRGFINKFHYSDLRYQADCAITPPRYLYDQYKCYNRYTINQYDPACMDYSNSVGTAGLGTRYSNSEFGRTKLSGVPICNPHNTVKPEELVCTFNGLLEFLKESITERTRLMDMLNEDMKQRITKRNAVMEARVAAHNDSIKAIGDLKYLISTIEASR